MPVIAEVLIALFLGGGVSFAAQGSLPGDFLYPVKTHVNEAVEGTFAVSAQAKANWEVALASRRLNEADALMAQGRLDTKTRTDLEDQFEVHEKNAETDIRGLQAKGDNDAAATTALELETSLDMQNKILSALATKSSSTEDAAASIRAHLVAPLEVATSLRVEGESKVQAGTSSELEASANGKINAADNVIAEAHNYINQQTARLGAQATANAQAQVNVAESLNAQAKAKVKAGAYGDAFSLATQALHTAEDSKELVEAHIDLGLDLGLGIGGANEHGSVGVEGNTNISGDQGVGESGSVNGNVNGTVRAGSGVLEGKVSIGPLCPVEPVSGLLGGKDCNNPSADVYAQYQLLILNSQGTLVQTVQVGSDGRYHASLAPGDYSVKAEHDGQIAIFKDAPGLIRVASSETTTLDIHIDTGIR